ncbi:MAG: TonB-dependent receptor [Niabella sp.]
MKKYFLVIATTFLGSLLYAQTETPKGLDEVTVTATKKPMKQSQTGKVVTIIDQATLQRNVGKSLTEILNMQAGIFTVGANNAPGSNQELYMRGANTSNTLVLIDGTPLQDPSNISTTYDLNNINPSQIERIEILKGAQSTLWGSNAVAGVINIITKKGGAKEISPNAMLSYGTYNTFKGSAGANGALKNFNYNLIYNYTNTDGFSAAHDSTGNKNFDKDGLSQNNFQANLGYRLSNKLSAAYLANYGKYNADTDADAFTDDKDSRVYSNSFLQKLSFVFNTEKANIQLSQSHNITHRDYIDDSTDISSPYAKWSQGNYKGQSYVTDLFGNFTFTPHLSLVGGMQYIHQRTDYKYKSIGMDAPYTSAISDDSAKTNTFSAYASLLLLDLHGFNNELGLRYNHHSIYGDNTTFTFNPSYQIDEYTRAFVNISSGYRTPSFYELYSKAGNKDLKPETSMNYELGMQVFANNKKSSYRIVGFKRDIKNLIIYYSDQNTYMSQYINRDKQHDYGFEIEAQTTIGKNGNWTNNLTYIDGEGTVNDTKTQNLYRRPNFTFNSALTIAVGERLTFTPAFRFVGSRLKSSYDAGPERMPHYYNIDFYAAYHLAKYFRLFADFRNITDQKYFDIPGYNSRRFNCTAGIAANF